MIEITQVVPAQNESCAAALTVPPTLNNPMSWTALSRDRRT